MLKRILTHKGYSFATWTITFAVIFAALAIIQVPLKRGIAKKVKGTTDYLLWGQFGDEVKQHSHDATTMSKARTATSTTSRKAEEEGVTTLEIGTEDDPATRSTGRIVSGVSTGSESVLKLMEDHISGYDLESMDMSND